MSEENVEVVERLIAALNARDVDQYLALCTPDVELLGVAAEIEGVARGEEGARAYLSTVAELLNSFRVARIAVEQLQALDSDRVLALTRVTGESEGGLPVDQPTASLYYFAGAKVRRIEVFLDRAEALEAAGLSE
jgi:ketosteroid isomerase-like protein